MEEQNTTNPAKVEDQPYAHVEEIDQKLDHSREEVVAGINPEQPTEDDFHDSRKISDFLFTL